MNRWLSRLAVGMIALGAIVAAGCGPSKPSVVLEAPKDYPAALGAKTLYHTPQGYIYAASEIAAGEADGWLKEVKSYVKHTYKRELGKGVVIVMEPSDRPVAATLEEELAMERDPTLIVTPPRKPKPVEDLRRRLAEKGMPEQAMLRGVTVPLTAEKLRQLGLQLPGVPWAAATPSHALAVECGLDVAVGAICKQRPDITPEQARRAASWMPGNLAKAFEITRGDPVFILWTQQQKDWSDDQRRQAILERLRHTCRSNWLPAPKDEDLEW